MKSHAGILETDDQATLARKLDGVVVEPDAELRIWMRDRLAPLVGLRTDVEPPSQDEAFAAWRRFLASLATDGHAVLVVEDLHWADEAMVAFLLDLADQPVAGGAVHLANRRVHRRGDWRWGASAHTR